jgi:hypothetical protein
MATGIGAPLGAALDIAGTGLAISGSATAIAAVAGPNIAYAVQDGDGGGAPDESSDAGGSSGEPPRDEQARALAHEHGDGKGGPQLTLENAYKALADAPEGTSLRKMPEEHEIKDEADEKNPDIEILDRQGNVVGHREVKTQATGGAKRFGKNLSDAVNQLRQRGGSINQIFYQVPKESHVYRGIARWKGNRTGVSDLNRFTVHVVDDTGEDLGTYNLGDSGGGSGGGGGGSGATDAMRQGLLNKERAMEAEGF